MYRDTNLKHSTGADVIERVFHTTVSKCHKSLGQQPLTIVSNLKRKNNEYDFGLKYTSYVLKMNFLILL